MKTTRKASWTPFFLIFMDFETQLGSKLGRKLEPRQDKTGQESTGQGKTREDKAKTGQREDLSRQRVETGFSAGGEGVTRLLGGDRCEIYPLA